MCLRSSYTSDPRRRRAPRTFGGSDNNGVQQALAPHGGDDVGRQLHQLVSQDGTHSVCIFRKVFFLQNLRLERGHTKVTTAFFFYNVLCREMWNIHKGKTSLKTLTFLSIFQSLYQFNF